MSKHLNRVIVFTYLIKGQAALKVAHSTAIDAGMPEVAAEIKKAMELINPLKKKIIDLSAQALTESLRSQPLEP